jgi:hypothetical protein
MASERTGLNVRADIVITRELPGTAPVKVPATIWWYSSRFHAHIASGLPVDDLLALASSPGGLGHEPRTIEEFMDTWTELSGVTEIYGDRTEPHGTVIENSTRLQTATELLLPLAELVLSGEVTGLKPTARRRLLEREAAEYTTYLTTEDGARSKVRRMVSGPYTLLREVTDEQRGNAVLRVEVTHLEEGASSDSDVSPPA